MSKRIIEIETVRWGQPRAYANSFYELIISMRQEGMGAGNKVSHLSLTRDAVLKIAVFAGLHLPEKPAWHQTQLKTCEPIGPTEQMEKDSHSKWQPKKESRWRVVAEREYLD